MPSLRRPNKPTSCFRRSGRCPLSPLGEKVLAAAKEGVVTTLAHNFPKPRTADPVPKESYITRVGNQGCGVGYFK